MFVFVCWTPYQIFNAINFVMNDVEHSKGNADIYVYHEFNASERISEALKKANIFSHVYDVNVYDTKKVWYSKFNKIKRLLMPYSTTKKFLRTPLDVRKQGYDTLVISGNNLFAINIYNAVKDLKVYFIDDGTASYFGDFRRDDITPLYRLFNTVFHRGPMSYKVEKFFANNKEICKTEICDNIIQLPPFVKNSAVEEKMDLVFSYRDNTYYKDKKVIYLTQPLTDETAVGASATEKEQALLSAIQEDVLLRVHPIQKPEEYAGFQKDDVNNLWELECAKQLTDDHVLVAWFSTAQFVPKMIFNKEPTVVFTYELFGSNREEFENMVEMLRSLYKDPSKVIVVHDITELQEIIKQNQV